MQGCPRDKVGELGRDKLVAKPVPVLITFGQLAEKYLANYPFNKQSTKELHEQVVKYLLVPKWADAGAINIDPPKLKSWFLGFDVESSTRGKYKSIMSGVYWWGQCEGLIPRGEQFNPCRYVKGREFSLVTEYEALVLEIEDTFKVLSELQQPVYELALLVATCGLRISEALGLRWRNVLWDRGLIAITGNVRPSQHAGGCQNQAFAVAGGSSSTVARRPCRLEARNDVRE
jgi:integrase